MAGSEAIIFANSGLCLGVRLNVHGDHALASFVAALKKAAITRECIAAILNSGIIFSFSRRQQ